MDREDRAVRDTVVRMLRMKGRATSEQLSASCGVAAVTVGEVVDELRAAGVVEDAGARLKLTELGRSASDDVVERERATLDPGDIEAAYERFCDLNAAFKETVTAWQLRPDGSMNDHGDPSYDAGVLARLEDLHGPTDALVTSVAEVVPRLARYRERFADALDRIRAGETSWLTAPLVDSYHTVWFELHEDLIALCGRTRAHEAAAGRAT